MKESQNITAIYRTQWLVEIIPDSENKGLVEPTGTLSYDPGTSITIQSTPKEGFFFNGWTTRGSIFLANNTQSTTRAYINGTGTIRANFASTTVQIRIVFQGINSYNDTILTVDDKTYKYPELLKNNLFNLIAGSSHTIKATQELPINNSTRYQFATWRYGKLPEDKYVVPYGNATIAAVYRPQYYLTLNNGGYGTVNGEGWRLSGIPGTISVEPTSISVGTGVQYVFKGWTSSSPTGYTGTNSTASFAITEPLTETVIWEMVRIPLTQNETTTLWLFNIAIVGICAVLVASLVVSKLRKKT
jgi:hypothetical protein